MCQFKRKNLKEQKWEELLENPPDWNSEDLSENIDQNITNENIL
jgi:hypothetical protein